MSKTPVTPNTDASQFIPREFLSPNKDQPGVSKTVFSHVSNLHGLLTDWSRLRDKGTRFLRAVSAIKLHEYNDDYYPSQLKPLMESIVEILESLKNIVEGVNIIQTQIKALSKIPPLDSPVISTWTAQQISESIDKIYKLLLKEYNLKQCVTVNIAHCRDESLIEVYASSWELEPYLGSESSAYLFAEMGMSGIT